MRIAPPGREPRSVATSYLMNTISNNRNKLIFIATSHNRAIAQSDAHNFDAARSMLNSNADTETAMQLTTPDA